MGNYCADDKRPDFRLIACFAHWFRDADNPREWVRLKLLERSAHEIFYIEDFAKTVIPAAAWEAIEEVVVPNLWYFHFDLSRIDADSLFFALTCLRYPQEFNQMTKLYYDIRKKTDNINLAFIYAHALSEFNQNHSLSYYSLFTGQTDEALKSFSFAERWVPLVPEKPYVKSWERKIEIFKRLNLTNNNPYDWYDVPEREPLVSQLARLTGYTPPPEELPVLEEELWVEEEEDDDEEEEMVGVEEEE